MFLVEIYLRGGAVVGVECEDFDVLKGGPMHRIEAIEFVYAEEAKSQVSYIDFTEMVAWKFTKL